MLGACEIARLVDGQIVNDMIDIEIPGANTKEKFMKRVKAENPDCLLNVLGDVKFIARTYRINEEEFLKKQTFATKRKSARVLDLGRKKRCKRCY